MAPRNVSRAQHIICFAANRLTRGALTKPGFDGAVNKFHNALVNRRPVLLDKLFVIDPNTYSSMVIRTEDEGIVAFNQISGTEYKGPLKFIITLNSLKSKSQTSNGQAFILIAKYPGLSQ